MKHLSFRVVFVLLLVALVFPASLFAQNGHKPIIGFLPDINIGNAEDNEGFTVDIGFYRFPDAVCLDNYVCDLDDPTSEICWSFYENDGGPDGLIDNFDINGVTQLASPDDAMMPGAKELTNCDNPEMRNPNITIWDIKACPAKDGMTYNGISQELSQNIPVIFYASDGTNVDSREIVITSVDGGFDQVIPTFVAEPVFTFDDPTFDGWEPYHMPAGTFVDDWLGGFYIAEAIQPPGMIAVDNPTSGTDVYGSWGMMEKSFIKYEEGAVYRATYTLRTDQDQLEGVPMARLRWSDLAGLMNSAQFIDEGPNALTTNFAMYNSYYFEPPADICSACRNMRLYMDLIDFRDEQVGNIYCDSIQVSRLTPPGPGDLTQEAVYDTPADFADWSPFFAPAFDKATTGTEASGGVWIETPGPLGDTPMYFGGWVLDPAATQNSFEATKTYKVTFTLRAATEDEIPFLPSIRIRVSNGRFDWIAQRSIRQVPGSFKHEPAADGSEYSIFIDPPPEVQAMGGKQFHPENGIVFSFDAFDGNEMEFGRVYLDKVVVESFSGF